MKRLRLSVLAIFIVTAAACDATQITTADAPPPACGDGPTMGSGC